MMARMSTEQIRLALNDVTAIYGSRVFEHIESGVRYMVIGALWSTDLRVPVLAYSPIGSPGVVFSRDYRVFDGQKFRKVEVVP